MDYEKKYKDALAKAKEYFTPNTPDRVDTKGCLVTIFPELAESEDERVRKAIDRIMRLSKAWDIAAEFGLTAADIRAWLEKQKEGNLVERKYVQEAYKKGLDWGLKQKEQKPADRIEDSVKFEEGFIAGRESGLRDGQKYVLNNLDSYGLCKPAEWSEEEKDMLNQIYSCIRWAMNDRAFGSCKRLIGDKEGVKLQDFLRSITKPCVPQTEDSPCPTWKPSKEQVEAVRVAAEIGSANDSWAMRILKGLYIDLKKLM